MRRACNLLLLAALLAASALRAQPGMPGGRAPTAAAEGEDAATREERLRQHEERVRQIIERRRQERSAAPAPGEPQEAPAEPSKPALTLGNTLYYVAFRIPDKPGEVQLDTVVRAGERFVSEVRLHNEASSQFDRVRLALRYDKRFLRPLRLFDSALRTPADPEPQLEVIERDSIIVYDLALAEPRISKELPVLRIVWEALRPTEHTGLNFAFHPEGAEGSPHTAVYSEGLNILGNPEDPIDGVLGGSILVLKPFDPDNERPEILQGKREELREIALGTVASRARVGLRLAGGTGPQVLDEDFHVEVRLDNPVGAIIDTLQFFVQFDPTVLQVVDEDSGNWIKRGVNIHDGLYRRDFPFDFHRRNEVDNVRGYVNYAMGLSEGLSLPSATFARIRFRPIKPAAETSIELIAGKPGLTNRTTIQNFGFEVFSPAPALTTALYATAVLPEHPSAVIEGDVAAMAAAAGLPPTLYVLETFPRLDTVRQIPQRP